MTRPRSLVVSLAVVAVAIACLLLATGTRSRLGPVDALRSSAVSHFDRPNEVAFDNTVFESEELVDRDPELDASVIEPEALRAEAITLFPEGLTEDHRRGLLASQKLFHSESYGAKELGALSLAAVCVGILLRSKGRADLGTPGVPVSHRPRHENEWVFSSQGALFRFDRGEFPLYDQLCDRMQSRKMADREPFPEDLVVALDALAVQALDAFESGN